MRERYKITTLRAMDVARSYAVIRHLLGTLSLEQWQAATATELQRRKWLTVVDAAGVVRGLCYMYVRHKAQIRRLEVPVFAAVSLVDEKRVARELFDVATDRALRLDCDVVHFWPAELREWSPDLVPLAPERGREGLIYVLRFTNPTS
jgi:hypothetical protein